MAYSLALCQKVRSYLVSLWVALWLLIWVFWSESQTVSSSWGLTPLVLSSVSRSSCVWRVKQPFFFCLLKAFLFEARSTCDAAFGDSKTTLQCKHTALPLIFMIILWFWSGHTQVLRMNMKKGIIIASKYKWVRYNWTCANLYHTFNVNSSFMGPFVLFLYCNFTYFLFLVFSPGDTPARMGLQESSEQIPGQCIQEGKGRMNTCVLPSVDWLVGCSVWCQHDSSQL